METSTAPVKRKILDLAFYAFNQAGYKGVSMDQVSRQLKISKKTIYKHFHSKEEILETAMEELFSQVESQLQQVSNKMPAEEAIELYFTTYRHFLQSFSKPLREEVKGSIPHLADRVQAFERQVLHRSFNGWLKSLRNQKKVQYPSPTRELTSTLLRVMKGLADSPEDKVKFVLQTLVKGMAFKAPKTLKSAKKKKKK